jgi:alpha-glucosidase (family GH31 glycosyl hydrolase)
MITINRNPIDVQQHINVKAGEELKIDITKGGHWYGHGFNHDQPYPLETKGFQNKAFAVNNIQSPIWMCSAGHVFIANTYDPLSVSFNHENSGFLVIKSEVDFELITISGENLVDALTQTRATLGWKRTSPPPETIGDVWFCTWTQYPRAINQDRILDMARQIRNSGYPCSTIVIDDRWESCFGELTFGDHFPDPVQMVKTLHQMNFRIVLWVTPFVNTDSAHFKTLSSSKALVQHQNGQGAATFRWWGGEAGLIDFTGAAGKDWFHNRLLELKNHIGVDAFKIDGGDAKYMPTDAEALWHETPGRSGYSDLLLEAFEEVAPFLCESRSAWLSQSKDIIWRLGGKDSHWGQDNGLKALVHLGLHLSLMGYDLLIPDMIPGRVQTLDSSMPLPTDELMIRWTETSCFFPLSQFSYFPWNYEEPTKTHLLHLAKAHKALEKYIVESSAHQNAPLLRPLWYDEPENQEYYKIGDQFFLGEDLLVCPVLDPGQHQREVILPKGDWIDARNGQKMSAGKHIVNAPCPGMPVFVKNYRQDLVDLLQPHLKMSSLSTPSSQTTASYSCGLDRDLSVTG